MSDEERLRQILSRIDGRGYPAYREIKGRYHMGDFTLVVDHVQGDPFAAPSRMRVIVENEVAGFPPSTWEKHSRAVALSSFLAEAFSREARHASGRMGSGKSGLVDIMRPGQEMLPSTAVQVEDGRVEARFQVGLPARGRRVLGRQAARLLCEAVPGMVQGALVHHSLPAERIDAWCDAGEDQQALRAMLEDRQLVAFVADGSILPRRSGVDDRPLTEGTVVPFQSPESMRVSFTLPNAREVTGMGIPRGVTLIVGGGFHGKSCLLAAIERGVYDHRPGDGRERVATIPETVKIRAEEGRRVEGVDISAFISGLPHGKDTAFFRTDNASGSTSQAAGILEALEMGCRLILIDEDTAATNFMIRDHRMQELVSKDREPITPYIDRARQLYDQRGVSTILVIGGSGDYFDVADTVIAMDSYVPEEATRQARAIARRNETRRQHEGSDTFPEPTPRVPLGRSVDPSRGKRDVKLKVQDVRNISFGEHSIDLSAISQLVHRGQTRAIAEAMVLARYRYMDGSRNLREVVDLVMQTMQDEGLDGLANRPMGDLAAFRRFELASAVNRLRSLQVAGPSRR